MAQKFRCKGTFISQIKSTIRYCICSGMSLLLYISFFTTLSQINQIFLSGRFCPSKDYFPLLPFPAPSYDQKYFPNDFTAFALTFDNFGMKEELKIIYKQCRMVYSGYWKYLYVLITFLGDPFNAATQKEYVANLWINWLMTSNCQIV